MCTVIEFDLYHDSTYMNKVNEIVDNMYEEFNDKWGLKSDRNKWTEYWVNLLSKSGVSHNCINYTFKFCMTEIDEVPTVFYFIHLCIIFDSYSQ
ncbi:MAG: hypothetical protein DIZ80_07935 [endosymbiont of Galathealinum brachiosum]|uniref:Uncharacterized protein n=1 Tax=endosymbiont of Galathealinum brachiosum TaxID=2200906 RepID=A0A370DGT7_9GAMM|nr:MAG: hypothetical protein DIZ80_07935 [endosymbiont of Galathealinum brachiosum]